MPFYNEISDHTSFSSGFSSSPRSDFGVYGRGYAFVAQTVARELINSNGFPDYKAYPVVFLFRHALELYLKHIIYMVARLAAFRGMQDIDFSLHNCHYIDKLSHKAHRLMILAFPNDASLRETMDRIVEFSEQFAKIDPNSYSYRYPIDTKGQPSTPPNQNANIHSIAYYMSEILDYLDTIEFGFDVETSVAQEIHEELNKFSV